MLYHGSHNPNLIEELSSDGVGTGTNCSALFFTGTVQGASFYGPHIYRMHEDLLTPEDYFDERDASGNILGPLLREHGIDYNDNIELCWDAIVEENLSYEEREEWAELVDMSEDEAGWFAQALRLELARRMGVKAVGMEDECGSIAVLREHVVLERVEICPECGRDRNSEDCDCDEE